jgi:hypothetical protein
MAFWGWSDEPTIYQADQWQAGYIQVCKVLQGRLDLLVGDRWQAHRGGGEVMNSERKSLGIFCVCGSEYYVHVLDVSAEDDGFLIPALSNCGNKHCQIGLSKPVARILVKLYEEKGKSK